MDEYFSLDNWDFGDTFYFSELSAYLHSKLTGMISSVILVASDSEQQFGTLYEIKSKPNEIFVSAVSASDISVITTLSPKEFLS
jgi:hypothetical protein